jgi:hypothetical protein
MNLDMTRRQALLTALFGAGGIGLRSLATGLPSAFLLNPKKALAQVAADPSALAPQYLILSTTGSGDPVNVNAPGAYGFNSVTNAPQFAAATGGGTNTITLGGQSYQAANVWGTLPQAVLDRTSFFHHATQTIVHPDEPKVLRCFDNVRTDPVAAMVALANQPALGTIQREPVSLGGDAFVAQGKALPNLSPTGLAQTLLNPTSTTNGLNLLTNLQAVRDHDLDTLNALFKASGSKAEQAYLDKLALSQTQVRQISQGLINTLSSIKDNGTDSQMIAACVLFRMNVTAAVGIHVAWGGDNHVDPTWKNEVAQHQSALVSLNNLFSKYLPGNPGDIDLTDKVTFATLQVFGRVLNSDPNNPGRAHNGQHSVGVLIGKNVKSGVVGGLVMNQAGTPVCAPIDSATGTVDAGGDVQLPDSLCSYGRTIGGACGMDETTVANVIATGTMVKGALAG